MVEMDKAAKLRLRTSSKPRQTTSWEDQDENKARGVFGINIEQVQRPGGWGGNLSVTEFKDYIKKISTSLNTPLEAI